MRVIPWDALRAAIAAIAPDLRHGTVLVTVHDGEPAKVSWTQEALRPRAGPAGPRAPTRSAHN